MAVCCCPLRVSALLLSSLRSSLRGGRLPLDRLRAAAADAGHARQGATFATQAKARSGQSSAPPPLQAAAAADPTHVCDLTSVNCWSCGSCTNRWNLFCGTCAYIQPLDGSTNYFSLMGIPQSFDLDADLLDQRFKQLQRTVHPDLFGTRSKHEQDLSACASSEINIAYQILKQAPTRAHYLLQLHGVDAIGETAGSSGKYVEPSLLMEIMEARETAADASTDAKALAALRASAAASVVASIQRISQSFAKGDIAGAAKATVALQYYTKLRDEVEDRLALAADDAAAR